MEIRNDEFEILGKWVCLENKLVDDESPRRINYLKENYLKKIAVSESGWEILYIDTNDARYWELIYKESENHGGGAPSLINIDEESAIKKYNLFESEQ